MYIFHPGRPLEKKKKDERSGRREASEPLLRNYFQMERPILDERLEKSRAYVP